MELPPVHRVVTGLLLVALVVGTWTNAAGQVSRAAPVPVGSRVGLVGEVAGAVPAGTSTRRDGEATAASKRPAASPDPLQAPHCPGVALSAVSDLGDPDLSLATLRSADDASPRARRFRGSVGTRRVVYIGEHPRTRRATAWLSDGRELCRVELGREPPPAASVGGSRTSAAAPGGAAQGGANPGGVAQLVEQIDDETYRIDRRLIDLALGGGDELAPAIRGVNGRLGPAGFVLARVPPGSLPARLGLVTGETIAAVNGQPLTGLEALTRAHAALSRSSRVALTVVRAGAARELVYEIR